MSTPILEHLSPPALAEAADANFVTHAGWVQGRLPGMRVDARGDLVTIDSGVPCDTFNFVCRARLDPERAPDRIRQAIDGFRRHARPFSWWVGPADRPADLGERLVAAGLRRAETELAMAVDLDALRPAELGPGGLRIERVDTEAGLRAFAAINAANWMPPDPDVIQFLSLIHI